MDKLFHPFPNWTLWWLKLLINAGIKFTRGSKKGPRAQHKLRLSAWNHFSVIIQSYQYRNFHDKDKTVPWPSYLCNGNPYLNAILEIIAFMVTQSQNIIFGRLLAANIIPSRNMIYPFTGELQAFQLSLKVQNSTWTNSTKHGWVKVKIGNTHLTTWAGYKSDRSNRKYMNIYIYIYIYRYIYI